MAEATTTTGGGSKVLGIVLLLSSIAILGGGYWWYRKNRSQAEEGESEAQMNVAKPTIGAESTKPVMGVGKRGLVATGDNPAKDTNKPVMGSDEPKPVMGYSDKPSMMGVSNKPQIGVRGGLGQVRLGAMKDNTLTVTQKQLGVNQVDLASRYSGITFQ
jgi:hypothetical protein